MTWNEQADTMMKAWTEGQKQLWDNWFNLVQGTSVPSPYVEMAKQWHEMSMRNMQGFLSSVEPTAKDTARHLFAGQDISMRMLEFITNAWKKITDKVEAGQDLPSALADYTQKMQQELLNYPQSLLKASQDSIEFSQLLLAQIQKLSLPWIELTLQMPQHIGTNGTMPKMSQFTNLYGGAFDQTIGPLLESPTFGLTREVNEKILKTIATQNQLRQATLEYQSILSEINVQAFEQLMRRLISMSQKGESVTTLRQLTELWRDVADPVFIETFNSERYIRVQGNYLNTMMSYRIQQREIIELVLQNFDIPTRSEVDEIHRHIYEQRKEIRVLRQKLEESHKIIELLRHQMENMTTESTNGKSKKNNSVRQLTA